MQFRRQNSRPPIVIDSENKNIFDLSRGLKQLWDAFNNFKSYINGEIDKIKRSLSQMALSISRLSYPNTSVPAIVIDEDGGLIINNIWRFIVIDNIFYLQYDNNLGVGSRDWIEYWKFYPSLQ